MIRKNIVLLVFIGLLLCVLCGFSTCKAVGEDLTQDLSISISQENIKFNNTRSLYAKAGETIEVPVLVSSLTGSASGSFNIKFVLSLDNYLDTTLADNREILASASVSGGKVTDVQLTIPDDVTEGTTYFLFAQLLVDEAGALSANNAVSIPLKILASTLSYALDITFLNTSRIIIKDDQLHIDYYISNTSEEEAPAGLAVSLLCQSDLWDGNETVTHDLGTIDIDLDESLPYLGRQYGSFSISAPTKSQLEVHNGLEEGDYYDVGATLDISATYQDADDQSVELNLPSLNYVDQEDGVDLFMSGGFTLNSGYTAYPGQDMQYTFTVGNFGNLKAEAGSYSVNLIFYDSETVGDIIYTLDASLCPAVPAGGSVEIQLADYINWPESIPQDDANHELALQIVSESDLGENNNISSAVNVYFTSIAPLDLSISITSVTGDNLQTDTDQSGNISVAAADNDTMTFNYSITCHQAALSTPFSISLIDSNSAEIYTEVIDVDFTADGTLNRSFDVDMPDNSGNIVAGEFTLVVDSDSEIPETNEGNNEDSINYISNMVFEQLTVGTDDSISYTEKTIASGEIQMFYFAVQAGVQYRIQWDDSWDGSGSYTADIGVTLYEDSSFSNQLWFENDGYGNPPRQVTASSNGFLYIGVSPNSSGDYAIRVYER